MNFIKFLTEAAKEGKNVHLEHLEDHVLNEGISGSVEAINFLRSLRDMLAGHAQKKVKVTTKWDGAPAVICGINPENGKFFVGTKSVFAKDAKLNYTDADIDKNHPGEGLNQKLKVALRYLSKLNIKGVLQGDMMFTKGDIKEETIDGEDYIAFRPNTILYAVPRNSKLAQTMLAAEIGIVFHTSYTGPTIQDMKSSFNVDIGKLSHTKDVWFRDADFMDASGTATFTKEETIHLTGILSDAGRLLTQINSKFLNSIALNEKMKVDIKAFNNTKVRAGQEIRNTGKHVVELIKHFEEKLNKNIIDAKKEDTKQKRIAEKNEIIRLLRNNSVQLKLIFDLMNRIVEAKLMIVKKLQEIKGVTNTFIQTENGYKITNPEGFVAVDLLKGGALKLIDRLEFSRDNFNAAKSWSK